jgi:Flp pilus assembly protein TadD
MGVMIHRRGHPAAAVPMMRRAIEQFPTFAGYDNNLGLALLDLSDFEGAHARFRRALELDPNAADAHHSLRTL